MENLTVTAQEMGAILGLTAQTLPRLVQRGYLPKHEAGGAGHGWNLGEIIRHLYALARAKKRGASDSANDRYRVARAKKAELEVGQMEGELISRDDADREYGRFVIEAKGLLANLPHLLGAQVPPELRSHIEEVADRHVRSILRSLETGENDGAVPGHVAVEVSPAAPQGDSGVVRQ